jgi:micrococcal nuclease
MQWRASWTLLGVMTVVFATTVYRLGAPAIDLAGAGTYSSVAFPFTPTRAVSGIPKVNDGDTIIVAGVPVRLNGIDAEELTEPHGKAARSALQKIVGAGPVVCGLTGEKTFNREVGVCFNSQNQDIGAELVRQGHALDCGYFSNGRYRSLEPSDVRSKLVAKSYCR